MTRWNLSIPEETDRVDRTFVARNDGKKDDLLRFVDETLRGRVLDLAARRVKDRDVGYDERTILDQAQTVVEWPAS